MVQGQRQSLQIVHLYPRTLLANPRHIDLKKIQISQKQLHELNFLTQDITNLTQDSFSTPSILSLNAIYTHFTTFFSQLHYVKISQIT